ncbi:2Fe-2S iron-sulfur cluster-binding protein [Rhodococcus pyridinivorans]|uniref:2Fe-2S iron-sulfur cluster-binding protein n=1 Tax=Rhodococcus pyridinivorans TaxID=103816 RepID=UPI0020C73BB0|nr:2Fe-2S iron-sulfur cluster-binding protein [Rhodococcus pyridinivorans]UTM38046.1 2Fe-2S iron-sulfur cluster-binding protein [Rhodococcus pyridinivorans]
MARITYISSDGGAETVDADDGSTVMQTALNHNIKGIVGECGGNALCATCHVYVDEAQFDQLPPIADFEEEMLDVTSSPRKDTSRLSCQITVSEATDGLIVRLPETQE